jgi:hypothetical protein
MGSEPSDHRFGVLIRRKHWVEDVLNPTIARAAGEEWALPSCTLDHTIPTNLIKAF